MRSRKPLAPYLTVLAVLVLGQGFLFCPDNHAQAHKPEPFFGPVIAPGSAEPFQIDALIDKIDKGRKPGMVVGEERILITRYKFEGRVRQTSLLGIKENPIQLRDFRIGQRVKVQGFLLPDKTIIADRIQLRKPMPSDSVQP